MKHEKIDLKAAFMPATVDLQERIEMAFERGEREMKKRHKIMSLLSAAAVFALVFAAGAFAVNEMRSPKPDNVAQTMAAGKLTAAQTAQPVTEDAAAAQADNQSLIFEPDFAHIDPADPNALETLLNMAYRDYCELNGIEMQSQWVDGYALNMLEAIPYEYGEEKENWIQRVRDVLKGYLGFDLDYIEKNCLTNYVIACLSYLPDLGYNVEAVSANVWNEGLENYLTEAYVRFCEEEGAAVYAGVLYRTAGELLDIPMKYGGDEALWAQPISMCLQEKMGLTAAFIEEWNLVEGITVSLREPEVEPEDEMTERAAVEITDGNAPAIERAYHFVEQTVNHQETDA